MSSITIHFRSLRWWLAALTVVLSYASPQVGAEPFTWGSDNFSQLGIGTVNGSNQPVATLTTGALAGKVVATLAVGIYHSAAVDTDGVLYLWGTNTSGQLGIGNTLPSAEPMVVSGGSLTGKTVTAVSVGQDFTLILASDGTVHACGSNSLGQLGQGNFTTQMTPVQVTGGALTGKTVSKIATGYYHALALTTDGVLAAWGSNSNGLLGDGTTTSRNLPVTVDATGVLAGVTITEISAASGHSAVVDSLGRIYTWGGNSSGQLGDGSTTTRTSPVAVVTSGVLSGKTISKVACGGTHTVALTSDGLLYAWGSNTSGALGIGSTGAAQSNPVAVVMTGALTGHVPVEIATTLASTTVLTADHLLFSWGQNDNGQLGDGTYTNRSAPTAVNMAGVLSGKSVTALSKGHSTYTILAAASDGTVVGWGADGNGIIGTGAVKWQRAPANVWGTQGDIAAVAAGREHTLFLRASGALYGMGTNLFSQLGTSPSTPPFRTTPLNMSSFGSLASMTVTAIAAGANHSAALTSNGSLHVWGSNSSGQVGNGTTATQSSPTIIGSTGLLAGKTISKVACGSAHTLVLASDGKLYAWGQNFSGQLGDGSTTQRTSPVAVNMTGVLAGKTITGIACGSSHSLCCTSDGLVFSWGDGVVGQLGEGATTSRSTPVQTLMTGAMAGKTIIRVAAGDFHSLAISADGLVYAWGINDFGQLGDGSNTRRTSPVAVTMSGALAGKTVKAGAGASKHSVLLSDDGLVFAMGRNSLGELGNNDTANANVPVAVDTSGELNATNVTAIAAGINGQHTIVAAEYLVPEIVVENAAGDSLLDGTYTASWGTLANSTFADKTFTIRSTGTRSLDNISLSFTGTGAGQFSVVTAPPSSIAAGASATFTLRFTATAAANSFSAVCHLASTDGDENPFDFNLFGACIAPVSITTHPLNKFVGAGANVTYSVVATGGLPISYQWRKGGVAIPSATSSSYTLLNVSVANEGSYDVVVSNAASSITSNAAILDIGVAPTISQQPVGGAVNPGQDFEFSVAASGTGTVTYQWYRLYAGIVAGTQPTLSLSSILEGQEDYYYVRVSNEHGWINSSLVYLNVRDPVSIFGHPQGVVVNPGSTVTLFVDIFGDGPVTYQWRKGGENIPGANLSYLRYVNAQESVQGSYDVVVSNAVNTVTSNAALVSINNSVGITSQPVGGAVNPGGALQLSVTAIGTGTLDYQWKRNGTPISGAIDSTYTASEAGSYTVMVTNIVGSVTSEAAVVTVNQAPSIDVPPASQIVSAGEQVTLGVTVSGTPPFQYQWQKDGQDLPLKTDSTLVLPAVSSVASGNYRVIVTNMVTSTTSETALLEVISSIPRILAQPSHQLVAAGGQVVLSVSAAGSPPLKYQWRKNGRNLAGAQQPTLTLNNVTTTSAGAYSVVVTAVNSATSHDAQVGVVSSSPKILSLLEGGVAAISIASGGTGLSYQWRQDGAPLALSSRYQLADQDRKLTIKPLQGGDSGAWHCVVTGPGGTLNSSSTVLKVITGAPDIEDTFSMGPLVIGSNISQTLICDSSPARAPTSFSARGLPPGLTIHASTGLISGKLTAWRAAPYEVTFTARNGKGFDTLTTSVTVTKLPDTTPGTYEGLVPRHAQIGSDLGGTCNIVVSSTASFTAKLLLGKEAFTLKGSLNTDALTGISTVTLPVPSKVLPGLLLDLLVTPGASKIDSVLRMGGTSHTFSAPLSPWKTGTLTGSLAGTYNTAYWSANPALAEAQPDGYGYCILTVGTTGSVSWRGRLADSTSFTGSGRLSDSGQVPLHLLLYSGTGSFQGWHTIASNEINGTATWFKALQAASVKTRSYREGFPTHDLVIAGGRYQAPAAGSIVLGMSTAPANWANGQVQIDDPESGPLLPLHVTTKHGVTPAAGFVGDLSAFKMVLTANTGEFSGSFTSLVVLAEPAPGTSVVSPYYGLIVLRGDFQLGVAHHNTPATPLLPDETFANTPILSRPLILQKAP